MSVIKISQLGELTSAADDDVLLITDTDASASKKITVANLVNSKVNTAVTNLVDSAPAALDTLNELAAALGDDANFATTVTTSIGTKWTQDNTKISNWDTAYGWGDHSTYNYVNTTALAAWTGSSNVTTVGTITSGIWNGTAIGDSYISSASNWNTAYGWGDHSTEGYIKDGFSVTAGTLTTANITTADFGNYTVAESAGVLSFSNSGTPVMQLDASGGFTVL